MNNDNWISVNDKLPKNGDIVVCSIQHWKERAVKKIALLIKVSEADCDWRVYDIKFPAELAYDYNVTHWMASPELPKDLKLER